MDYDDFDDDIELDEDEAWDDDTLGLDEWDESEARSVVRDLGITSAS